MGTAYVKLGLRVLLLSDLRERISDQSLWLKRSIAELARFRCVHPLHCSLVQLKHILEYRSQTHTAAGLVAKRSPQGHRDFQVFPEVICLQCNDLRLSPSIAGLCDSTKVELN
jgi:hypothetical protein